VGNAAKDLYCSLPDERDGAFETHCSERKISNAIALLESSDRPIEKTKQAVADVPPPKKSTFGKVVGRLLWPVKKGIWVGKTFILKPAWKIIREFIGPLLLVGCGAMIIFSCSGMFPPGLPLCLSLGVGVTSLYVVGGVLALAGVFSALSTIAKTPVILVEAAASPFTR
jgi:hypothetical protein